MNLQLASFGKGECAVLIGLVILTMYVLSVLYAAYSGSAAQAGSAASPITQEELIENK